MNQYLRDGREDRRHLLTVALEDYYQVGTFHRLIQRRQWYRFETRVAESTAKTLELLDRHGLRATFFVLGWIADQMPELVRQVASRGHEIASKGYYHRHIAQMTPTELREDLARAREALQRASGQKVLGYRVADGWCTPEDLWALDVLAEEGYAYDSSIAPIGRHFSDEPWRRFMHAHISGERRLWEFPISTSTQLGFQLPFAGGNYMRQLPVGMMRREAAQWHRRYTAPFVMYFHTWELDTDQPKIEAAPFLAKVRQYRNLEQMPDRLSYYFERYRFTSVADFLGLDIALEDSAQTALRLVEPVPDRPAPIVGVNSRQRIPVSIVIPCFNEELIVPYLGNTLQSVQQELEGQYDLSFIFVDDASLDGTYAALQRAFGERSDVLIVRHPENRGVAAGIMTGLRHATTEIACSIDCDCTYDPHELVRMIPMLRPGIDLVTASPYHRDGTVMNVPAWRLVLSRTASKLYGIVLRQPLATFTSCFRVYRVPVVSRLNLKHGGFLGVAEMVGELDFAGRHIAEYPATLEVRMLGRSKMKVLRTIRDHAGMLMGFAMRRLLRRTAPFAPLPEPNPSTPDAPTETRELARQSHG